MYTQPRKCLSKVLFTSLVLQSCNGLSISPTAQMHEAHADRQTLIRNRIAEIGQTDPQKAESLSRLLGNYQGTRDQQASLKYHRIPLPHTADQERLLGGGCSVSRPSVPPIASIPWLQSQQKDLRILFPPNAAPEITRRQRTLSADETRDKYALWSVQELLDRLVNIGLGSVLLRDIRNLQERAFLAHCIVADGGYTTTIQKEAQDLIVQIAQGAVVETSSGLRSGASSEW